VIDINSLLGYNTTMKINLKQQKPRNLIAKDLRTPKYRCRVESNKKAYTRLNTQQLMKENHYA
jgi:hypothetical protein